MHLKLFTDISLRVLIYLGRGGTDESASATVLVKKLNCSHNHLAKALSFMRQQGWVRARRGRVGGFALTEKVLEMGLGDIVRTLEGEKTLLNCDAPLCPLLTQACPLIEPLQNAREAFYAELNRTRLCELRLQRPASAEARVEFVPKKAGAGKPV